MTHKDDKSMDKEIDPKLVQDPEKESEMEDQNAIETENEVEKLKAELELSNDKYVRLYAEFDNFKRRTSRERVELIQSAGKDVISNLLTVLDDMDRALKMMESATELGSVIEGVELINQKFKKILQQEGLKEMNSIGEPFDADYHEAITNVPAPSADMKGKVVDEVEKGYLLNDKVLRYAKVVVGN